MTHATTDAVLDAQRTVLTRHTSPHTPMSEQRLVSRELLWHAMFMVASLHPHVDMRTIAELSRTAVTEGIAYGRRVGNDKL